MTLFASSVLNLCELLSLHDDLKKSHKVLYFHENQLVYPVRKQLERDFQYGYNQILSCMVADVIVFNSHFNKDSFLQSIDSFIKLIPDHRPKDLAELIRPKCHVLYFPMVYPPLISSSTPNDKGDKLVAGLEPEGQPVVSKTLHIVWPHRWEHDKGPDEFSVVLHKLMDDGVPFTVSLLGSHTTDIPESFKELIPKLGPRLTHSEYVPVELYWDVLSKSDVVVSTALHEFFGVAMMEATYFGCYPLCPNRLVYPELYPKECLYNTTQQLFKRLKDFCLHPYKAKKSVPKMDFDRYSWGTLQKGYCAALRTSVA
ncbi:tRNA-queuosine alpha-mannosyltransferase-like isoform X2 [Dysidea avara]|uniref:tRNA-queuosine alpha-mannosyltransferase-like isoform X2 n=1 Tax=Dysidea avara TaxID=196820 RepID=UPI0033177A74